MERNSVSPKARVGIGFAMLACVLAAATLATAQTTAQTPPLLSQLKRRVVVSIPDRKLAIIENDSVVRIFPVAVGAGVSPSPTGEFQIVNRLANPTYYHPGTVIPPGDSNPIGTRWVGLNKKGYGIHGTNAPKSIGKASSHGCIRLRNSDIEQFFPLVGVGDTVEIRGQRDAETASLFGGEGEATTADATQSFDTAAEVDGGQ